jgi:hypothetical protein
MPGDVQRRVPAQVVLDQGQRQVDPGGDPGGGGDVPVGDEDRVRVDGDLGEPGRERGAVGPVGGDPAPVEQARLGQQERAGADRDQPPGAGAVRAQPADQVRIGVPRALAARHEQHIRAAFVLAEAFIGREAQPAGGSHRVAARAGGTDLVRGPVCAVGSRGAMVPAGLPAVGSGEHLQRAGHVQALHPVEQDDQDRAHACQCAVGGQVAAMTNTPPFLPRLTVSRPGRGRRAAAPCRSTCTWRPRPEGRWTGTRGRSSPAAGHRTPLARAGPGPSCTAPR